MKKNNLIHADMKELALLTLYADYQFLPPGKRAEDIYLYFGVSVFFKIAYRRYVPHGKGKPKRYRAVLERLDRIVEE
ncbi:MAG: hypothetical protein ACLUUG_12780 [Lachnospiraceae bacterium]